MPRRLLTDFELMILLAILRVGSDAYGVPIAEEIERTGGRRAALGAIYAAIPNEIPCRADAFWGRR